MKRNEQIFCASIVLYYMASSLLDGGFVQSYMLTIGLDTQAIGLYGTLTTLVALCGYALFTGYRGGSNKSVLVGTGLLLCTFPVGLLLGATWFPLLYIGAIVYQLAMSIHAACEHSTAPLLFPRRIYASVSGRGGFLGTGIAACIGLGGALLTSMPALSKYRIFFIAAVCAFGLSALTQTGYRLEAAAEETSRKMERIPLRDCPRVFLPHFLRGVSTAFFYYYVPIALKRVTLSPLGSSLLVAVGSACMMCASFIFVRLLRHMHSGRLVLCSNLFVCAAAIGNCFVRTEAGFFALYALYMLAINVTGFTMPAGVLYSTKTEQMPFISAMRMLVLNGASCLLMSPVAALMEIVPAYVIALAGAAASISFGLIFNKQLDDRYKET